MKDIVAQQINLVYQDYSDVLQKHKMPNVVPIIDGKLASSVRKIFVEVLGKNVPYMDQVIGPVGDHWALSDNEALFQEHSDRCKLNDAFSKCIGDLNKFGNLWHLPTRKKSSTRKIKEICEVYEELLQRHPCLNAYQKYPVYMCANKLIGYSIIQVRYNGKDDIYAVPIQNSTEVYLSESAESAERVAEFDCIVRPVITNLLKSFINLCKIYAESFLYTKPKPLVLFPFSLN